MLHFDQHAGSLTVDVLSIKGAHISADHSSYIGNCAFSGCNAQQFDLTIEALEDLIIRRAISKIPKKQRHSSDKWYSQYKQSKVKS